MKRAALLLAVLALAGCGGDEDVPADAVAVVDGEEISRSDYEALINQAKTSYKNQKREFPAAGSQEFQTLRNQAKKSYANQKREFPAAGSQEFQTLRNQAVQYLVQREQFEQEAGELDVEVTDKQVDDRLAQIQKQYFGGDKAKYEKQLKEQGVTAKQVRDEVRAQLLSERIFARVTREVKVTDAQIASYYAKNKAQYSQPESREVRHILVKTKAQADDLHAQLQNGGDFAALAKKFSQDTGSKANGGKLTISKGQTVAPFDKAAFALKLNEISEPVKTEFGFHIIEPLSATKAAKVTPLKEVKASIRQQLQQTEKNEAMTKWVDELKDDYEDKVTYATGFTPPPEAKSTTAETE